MRRPSLDATDLLICGVCIGFLSDLLDNLYWAIPWTLQLLGHPAAQAWFDAGVYANIPFRQALTIFAALLHVQARHRG